jgi:lactoylglutathione lyase
MSLAMAMPSTGGETDNLLQHRTVKKPRGHYTARLPTRLPILRFRRHPINRRNQKWLHPAATILAAGGDPGLSEGWPCGKTAAKLTALASSQPMKASRPAHNVKGRATMPIVTWDHVHLRSPDPEATAAWLEDVLGGTIIRSPGRIDVKLGGANVFIAPVAVGDGVHTPPVTPYQGLDHFGLTVKDIDAVATEIKAKGVEFTKEPTTIRPGVRICFIRGPQGISVELLERDKKYA